MSTKTTDHLSLRNYVEDLHERLRDTGYAAAYLDAALEEGDAAAFLIALRHVAEARGISQLALESGMNRESMYRMLSEKGNPELSSLGALLGVLGLRLGVALKT